MSRQPPRLVPHRSLPAYAYAGHPDPHPIRDPGGHSHGERRTPPAPLNPERFRESEDYLFGIDLFNRGYYWEAHDAWEGLWKAAGKSGAVSDFLKGLIKLAACGVKVRQGLPGGIRKHSRSAIRHFQAAARDFPSGRCAGLGLGDLSDFAREVGEMASLGSSRSGAGAARVFDRLLIPEGP